MCEVVCDGRCNHTNLRFPSFLVSIFLNSILSFRVRREMSNIRQASLTEYQPDSCEVVCEVMWQPYRKFCNPYAQKRL